MRHQSARATPAVATSSAGSPSPGTRPRATTLAEPSSAQLRDLADALTALGVDAVFTDPSQSDAVVETLVDEVGRPIEVIELYTDALGEPGSGADTYEGMMRTNVERIRDALAPSR